jgi:prepilin-type N-terminal cleavage/methylation domain-containing protein
MTTRLKIVWPRRGFTLTELMVVIAIISFLAVGAVTSMYGAAEAAKRMRTQQTIGKLDAQLMPRWESYMTRRLPFNSPVATQATAGMKLRTTAMVPGSGMWMLWSKRELLRMDFPDRYTDLTFSPVFLYTPSTSGGQPIPYYSDLTRQYQRMITQWTGKPLSSALTTLQQSHQSAECLYMIITVSAQDADLAGNAFNPNEIGDTDSDGMLEFLDAWGNSIEFLRWAPGFSSDMQPTFSISPSDPAASKYYPKNLPPDPNNPGNFLSHFPVSYNPYIPLNAGGSTSSSSMATPYAFVNYHDAFDPLELDPGQGVTPVPERGYNLIPLIVSAGPDGTAGQLSFTSTSTTTSDTLASFGLHWGTSSQSQATSSQIVNTADDPYAVYASPDGTGQTQRGAIDVTSGATSYDNIHNQFLRTRP